MLRTFGSLRYPAGPVCTDNHVSISVFQTDVVPIELVVADPVGLSLRCAVVGLPRCLSGIHSGIHHLQLIIILGRATCQALVRVNEVLFGLCHTIPFISHGT